MQAPPSQEALRNSTLPDVNRFYKEKEVENLNSIYSDINDSTSSSPTQNSKNSNTFIGNFENSNISSFKQLFQKKRCTK